VFRRIAKIMVEVIIGNMPAGVPGEARRWARKNRALLTAEWLELNA
jgi:hypothetical protein